MIVGSLLLVGPPGKAVHWDSYDNYSQEYKCLWGPYCLLGPRASCHWALMTTIHRNVNDCGVPFACWAPGQVAIGLL